MTIERFILGYLYDAAEQAGAEAYTTLQQAEKYYASMASRADQGEFQWISLTKVVIADDSASAIFLKKYVPVRPKMVKYNKKDGITPGSKKSLSGGYFSPSGVAVPAQEDEVQAGSTPSTDPVDDATLILFHTYLTAET